MPKVKPIIFGTKGDQTMETKRDCCRQNANTTPAFYSKIEWMSNIFNDRSDKSVPSDPNHAGGHPEDRNDYPIWTLLL